MNSHRHPRKHRWPFFLLSMIIVALMVLLYTMIKQSPGNTSLLPMETTDREAPEITTAAPEKEASPAQKETLNSQNPSPSLEEQLLSIIEEMSLEEKVGQMFIARCPEENAAEKAKSYHLGGYILFARDFENKTKEQVITDIDSYQKQADIPLLIGVDEEGGSVNRISRYPAFRSDPFPSPQELYEMGGFEAVQKDTAEKSRFLKELGINLNFAPVCDISQDPEDFIYKRTLGQNEALTSVYVETVVKAMKQEQVGSVLKHFPGYGNNEDTHTGIAYDNRPYETFTTKEFLPFQAGIQAGANMVLVSHNIVKAMDESCPASLSPRVHKILREDLGFTGVIITDDLVMEGVRQFAGDHEAAVMAVQAGNDLLCCTDFETQIPAVMDAVKQGIISEEQIDQSVFRILKMKLDLGLIPALQ